MMEEQLHYYWCISVATTAAAAGADVTADTTLQELLYL